MKKQLLFTSIIFSFVINTFGQWQTYPFSPAGSVLTFPNDDGKHTAATTTTEWWYINLHLIGAAPVYKKYDVMLCYFSKPATMRIFNVANVTAGTFHNDVNQTPFVFSQLTGHWELAYTIPLASISDFSKWTFPIDNKTFSYVFHATSPINNDALDVTVTSNRSPLVVGKNGFIPIGGAGDSSFYYSYSNMKTTGTIKYAGVVDTISSGIAWIDRQWGPFTVGVNNSNLYEWFSFQLDKPGTTWGTPQTPSEFNVWQIFSDSTTIPYTPAYRLVSGIYPDNSQDTVCNFVFERTGYWHDVANNKYYSQGWRMINPARGLTIDMTAPIPNQIINVTLFKFWEGGTTLKGTVGNQPVDGYGFAELVAARKTPLTTPSVPTNLTVTPATNHYSLTWAASAQGTYPVGGYRIFRSTTNTGYWQYLATTTSLFYNDYAVPLDTGYFYTITSFDNQSHTSASSYANAVWVDPLIMGIEQIAQTENSLRVYPNPANDKIEIDLPVLKNTHIEIISAEGKILRSIQPQSEKIKVEIGDLANGVYIIKVISDQETKNKKLIKQ